MIVASASQPNACLLDPAEMQMQHTYLEGQEVTWCWLGVRVEKVMEEGSAEGERGRALVAVLVGEGREKWQAAAEERW